MRELRVITWPLRLAIGATVVAAGVILASVWRATHFAETPRLGIAAAGPKAVGLGSYRPALVSELDRAIDVDPFHPERRRPQIRYALRGPGPVADPDAGAPIPEMIELIGTVLVGGGRSFAMCRTGAGTQIVHVGDKFAGFTLKSVEQGSAVFVSPTGKTVNIRVRKTGS
jgi:hypothetical protein